MHFKFELMILSIFGSERISWTKFRQISAHFEQIFSKKKKKISTRARRRACMRLRVCMRLRARV